MYWLFLITLLSYFAYTDNLNNYLATNLPYFAPKNIAALPAGYQLEYIAVLLRHGSRYPAKKGKHKKLLIELETANAMNCLNERGKQLLLEVSRYLKVNNNKFGHLSELGAEEQFLLGQRLAQINPSFFNQKNQFIAYTTFKDRTKMSQHYFIKGFNTQADNSDWHTINLEKNKDPILRYFDKDIFYQYYLNQEPGIHQITTLLQSTVFKNMGDHIKKLFFRQGDSSFDTIKNSTLAGNNQSEDPFTELGLLIYHHIIFSYQNPQEKAQALKRVFTINELKAIANLNELALFYRLGPGFTGINTSYHSASIFLYFLNHEIKRVTKNTNHPRGLFFFAHHGTILSTVTLLNINGYNKPQIILKPNSWPVDKISPMAANLNWLVFSRNDNFFIQLRLNEKPVSIPHLKPVAPYLYTLDDYSFYTDQLIKSSPLDFNAIKPFDGQPLIDHLNTMLESACYKKHLPLTSSMVFDSKGT